MEFWGLECCRIRPNVLTIKKGQDFFDVQYIMKILIRNIQKPDPDPSYFLIWIRADLFQNPDPDPSYFLIWTYFKIRIEPDPQPCSKGISMIPRNAVSSNCTTRKRNYRKQMQNASLLLRSMVLILDGNLAHVAHPWYLY